MSTLPVNFPSFLFLYFTYSLTHSLTCILQIESLTSQIASTAVINADIQKASAAELEKHKVMIKASESAAAEAKKAAETAAAEVTKVAESAAAEETELRTTSESLQGEINRLKRCTESQSRDLKRAIREKDNLEKALQESHASAAAAASSAAAAAAAASDVATRKSPETPALLVNLHQIAHDSSALLV